MPLLRWILARFLIDRLLGGGRRRGGYRGSGGYGSPYRRGWGAPPPRRQGRFGFFGPFPSYTTRTRRGSTVSVTGCCLPFALGMLAVPVAAGRLLWRGVARR